MCITRVLALLALLVGLAEPFSWDIVVAGNKQLEFYHNGLLTHLQDIPSAKNIASVTFDPVHYKVIFCDYIGNGMAIYSFDLTTRKIEHIISRYFDAALPINVVYDAVTQSMFWNDGYVIYSYSLDPVSSNQPAYGNLLITLENFSTDLAVDSCGGYIYWITESEIERARLDGSGREVLIKDHVWLRTSLAIDKLTRTMYWTEKIKTNGVYRMSLKSADIDGKNRRTLYTNYKQHETTANSLAVSKDFLYWKVDDQTGFWQFPKKTSQPQRAANKINSISSSDCWSCQRLAANYPLKEHIKIKSCMASLFESKPKSLVHQSSDLICHNYCLQGNCSVSAEGKPKCSCKVGYSGERCEINRCHEHCLNNGVCSLNDASEPVCQCTAGYDGERCEVPVCKDYCLQGNCSVDVDRQPVCSCTLGYSGERCDINMCQVYNCLNGGVCSLNEEDEPYCQCVGDYEGSRCEVPVCTDNCANTERESESRCDASNSGEGEFNSCKQYCLNDGVCSLNENSEPICQCPEDYEGERCDVPTFLIKCFLYANKYVPLPVAVSNALESTCASPAV
ncbi:hypothetical protein PYW07_010725 [Mythimna separata]|uniref:EGF-like domain-containing protein n=1 Tax=Mythimna separata TaxID=271217 RepID=A0AAD8DL46_MYTSE|nr:hypothetical protein PYW07_010725 [Mythimna separata]